MAVDFYKLAIRVPAKKNQFWASLRDKKLDVLKERQTNKQFDRPFHAYYLSESRIHSFWARALHNEVFPVPGGPGKSTKFKIIYNDDIIKW